MIWSCMATWALVPESSYLYFIILTFVGYQCILANLHCLIFASKCFGYTLVASTDLVQIPGSKIAQAASLHLCM